MGYQGSTGFHPANTGGGGGGFYQIVEDEGVALPQRVILNFVGAGVTVTDVGGKTMVTIPGGGGGAPSGPAGGDLNGTYPNPGVTWANGYPTYDARYLQLGAAAGGDLGGTYPNPSVTWANGYPTYDLRYPQLSGAYIDPAWIATLDWAKITGAPSSFPPSGAAGGELSGTYPNPTLVNSAVTGKVLTGFISNPGTVGPTDDILQAFGKLDGNINQVSASAKLFNYYNFI